MKKIILICLSAFFLTTNLANAQESGNELKQHTFITFDGLTFLNPVHPRIRIGVAQDITKNVKVSMDVGFGTENMTTLRDIYLGYTQSRDYSLFELRGQVYYHFAPEGRINQYVGLEVYNVKHSETLYDEYYYDQDLDADVDFDRADFKRVKTGAQLRYGFFTSPNSRIGVNIYGGIGFRLKESTFDNVVNPQAYSPGSGYDVFGFGRKKGTSVGMDASIGLKLFFRL